MMQVVLPNWLPVAALSGSRVIYGKTGTGNPGSFTAVPRG